MRVPPVLLMTNSPPLRAAAAFLLVSLVSPVALGASEGLADPGFSVEKMDRTVDPRVDFVTFASGGWYGRARIPDDKSRWGGFDELRERNWQQLRALVEDAAATPGDAGSVRQKVGDLYASAIDLPAINERGLKPIAPTLAAIDAAPDVEALIALAAELHLKVGNPFFGASYHPDAKQSDRYAFHLSQGGMSLPSKEYYFSEKFARERWEFVGHIAKMLELSGEARAAAYQKAEVIFAFERTLAAKAKLPVDLRDRVANYHKMTLAEAVAAYPSLPLRRFITEIGLPDNVAHVIVGQPEFFEGLSQALATTSLPDLKAYVKWNLLRASASYLSEPYANESFRFFGTVLNGVPAQEPRWQRAARVVDGSLGEALGALYVERHYPPAAKARMDEMIANIRAVFRERLEKLDWMSEATRAKALEKFARFEPMIGYPVMWRDYSAVEILRDDYYGNIVRARLADSRRRIDRVGQNVDRREWGMTPPTVNAYYSSSTNQIVFPAGILQPPFFDFEKDDAVNYGAIGGVIGHEITHGFDDQGRRSDADGNLEDWWTEEDAATFRERAQKLVEQYNAYHALPGLAINGQLSLGENIADLGGTSIAFEALQRSLAGKERPLIDGLTPEQRFFVSWAQQWRTLYRDDAMRLQVARGPHAPGQFRALGPLVNHAEFFEAFGIKVGDPLWRPVAERCKIW